MLTARFLEEESWGFDRRLERKNEKGRRGRKSIERGDVLIERIRRVRRAAEQRTKKGKQREKGELW